MGEGRHGPVGLAVFIAARRVRHGVSHAVSCGVLGVSQAWFYEWVRRDVLLRRAGRAAVDAAVAYEFARRAGRGGSPAITTRMRDSGWRISKDTVAGSMRRQGLVARPKRRQLRRPKPLAPVPQTVRRDQRPQDRSVARLLAVQ